MRKRERLGHWGLAALLPAAWACGDDGGTRETNDADSGITTTQGTTGTTDPTQGTTTGEATESDTSATSGVECMFDIDCDDGQCLDGVCCDSPSVCGTSCCGGEELCLFDACVAPGTECTNADDCEDGQYCELAFGQPGGGFGDPPAPGLVCTHELPPTGSCIDLPDKCGEPDADPDNCIEACEFQPEVGQLNTSIKWQWGLNPPQQFPDHKDIWATPTVARIYDANCDGEIDVNDPPNLIFVAGNSNETCCSCGGEPISSCKTGVLRVLDGSTGQELWSLDRAQPGEYGWAGLSPALGDVTGDGFVDVVAMTGDGFPVVVDRIGQIVAIADAPYPDTSSSFGWGGGMAIADMNGDGVIEIAYGESLYRYSGGALTKQWDGTAGSGGGQNQAISYMVDVAEDTDLELLAGNTVYRADGTVVWYRDDLPDGFTAVGDLDQDGTPEVILVYNSVWVLDGATGDTELGPVAIPGNYIGGPPTVADFDGDTEPDIGIAGGQAYVVYLPNYGTTTLDTLWTHDTKDTSSARTGSSVFDFEGDGRAEVVYSDECFLRVLDGLTGELRFTASNTTFTATEALIVADVDGDAHAEIVRVSNSANWDCDTPPWNEPDPVTGRPAWEPPPGQNYYQGLTVFGDAQNSWVGTRKIWNQHAYHVSNVCDGRDSACSAANSYGELPAAPERNWTLPWLNNFRQNVQDEGIFDAPDAVVSLDVECEVPVLIHVSIRNGGFAPLPAGVGANVYKNDDDSLVGTVATTQMLLPGQTEIIDLTVDPSEATADDEFVGRIEVDPETASFVECRDDNNDSEPATAWCGPG